MNFGVIGPGKMGLLYIRDFIKCGAKLTYIKASTNKRTNKLINKFQKEGQIINNNLKSLDFLIISSKTNTHYKYINKFYKEKKLLIEKPFFFCKNKSLNWHLDKAKFFLRSKIINLYLQFPLVANEKKNFLLLIFFKFLYFL